VDHVILAAGTVPAVADLPGISAARRETNKIYTAKRQALVMPWALPEERL